MNIDDESTDALGSRDRHDEGEQRTAVRDGDAVAISGDRSDAESIEIEVNIREDVITTIETLEEALGSDAIHAIDSLSPPDTMTRLQLESLTEKQYLALEAAYEEGYFERPRRQSATEIADSLGVSHSTFLRHLRAAQQKTFRAWFE